MTVSSAIVEIRNGAGETVLQGLAGFENVSVFGIKENQIIAVIEDRDMSAVQDTIKKIYGLESVVGVYPVYAGFQDEQEAG